MRSLTVGFTAVWLILLTQISAPVGAQDPYVRPSTSPAPRPALSPYLNLLRGGNTAINYYGLVRPQEEFSSSIREFQQQVHTAQGTQMSREGGIALPVTGHPTRFFNYQGYFFTPSGAGSSGGQARGTPPTPGSNATRPGQPVSAAQAQR
jgi:hypothetical protein